MSIFDTTNPLEPLRPTPEQLAERMTQIATSTAMTPEMTQSAIGTIIAQAEAGGEEHMAAVADVIARIPDGPPPPNAPRYEAATGRPAWHETNVLLECQVRIDGRVFTAREALDPMMMELRFGDDAEFERFIEYFIKSSFGKVAVADPESYQYLRDRLWIVRPGDEHDMKRCAESEHPGAPWPRCFQGIVLAKELTIVPGERYAQIDRSAVYGQCPCRCHRAQPYGAKRAAALHGLVVFDELMVDEEGDRRV